ncbi:MAG: type III-A CRISPR-associated protein Cas10/Csm1 [Candidatus Competibacteraceae bacterium]|nr:type III-A CRISPR-associated protein Cas10/Csm1 [Candidatus Competibacteraceae bacterium]
MDRSQTKRDLRNRLDVSCRIALTSLLRDLGKFAERAGLAMDATLLSELKNDFPPNVIDSGFIAATAPHQQPETALDWVLTIANQAAAGLGDKKIAADQDTAAEQKRLTVRLLTLFEQINARSDKKSASDFLQYRYPLKPMTPASLFPVLANDCEHGDRNRSVKEYFTLWEGFGKGLKSIPASHREALPLWLDHFETLWACYTACIPSTAAPDVSFYDQSKTAAALAVALWRYHHDRGEDEETIRHHLADRATWDEPKFLLVQGDCFGIQEFIFATGGETQKRAAKLLRGRSFYVSLLSECAALKVLEMLDLPPTSQITNAAGKFLIVAPHTPEALERIAEVQKVLDRWFIEHTWGQSGIGLVWEPACRNDLLKDTDREQFFSKLINRLFRGLEKIKLQRFDLCGPNAPEPLFKGYLDAFASMGECKIDGRSPATHQITDGVAVCDLAFDQIAIGNRLTNRDRILITRSPLVSKSHSQPLKTKVFDYCISFTDDPGETGWFGPEARSGNLRRCWDITMPEAMDQLLWNGCARRHINGYVPFFESENSWISDKYPRLENNADFKPHPGEPKLLDHLACEDRRLNEKQRWVGVEALMTLKGDVDNLGSIFQGGLREPTFARTAALSRQMNVFFAVYLPTLCHEGDFRKTYTVFAGGDDFFLIGPWHSQIRLAAKMRQEFTRYVAGNPAVTFSAGLSMTKPGLPVRALAALAEEALEDAKKHPSDARLAPDLKDAVSCFGQVVGWKNFLQLLEKSDELGKLVGDLKLSAGYLYGLPPLIHMAENLRSGRTDRPDRKAIQLENALWHSRFAYQTRRLLERQKGLDDKARRRYQQEITNVIYSGIAYFASAYQIPLFIYLYQQRD